MVPRTLRASLVAAFRQKTRSLDLRDSRLFGVRARGARMILWMIKRSLFATIAFGALVCVATAQDARVSVEMIGVGSMSCAHWRCTVEHRAEGAVWSHGAWAGLNSRAAARVQTQPA